MTEYLSQGTTQPALLDSSAFPNFDKRRQVSSSQNHVRWDTVHNYLSHSELHTFFNQPGDYLALCCGDGVAEQAWADQLQPQSHHVFLDKKLSPDFSATHPQAEPVEAAVFAFLAAHVDDQRFRRRFSLVTLFGVEYLLMDPINPEAPELTKADALATLLPPYLKRPSLVVIAPCPQLNHSVWHQAGWQLVELANQVTLAIYH